MRQYDPEIKRIQSRFIGSGSKGVLMDINGLMDQCHEIKVEFRGIRRVKGEGGERRCLYVIKLNPVY